MGKRLKSDDWLNAGFDALAADGAQALAAEPMARRLGTTKGSFYWHFADVPAYHAALIEGWRIAALQRLAGTVSSEKPVDQRLRAFGHGVLNDRTETAMRIWAQANADAAQAVERVDAERLTYLNLLMREIGLGNPDFATALQATLVGLPQMNGMHMVAQRTAFDSLVDTILALSA